MNAIFYRIIIAVTAICCAFSALFGTPAAKKISAKQYAISGNESCYAGEGRVSVHDPSIIESQNGTYYIFGSHGATAKSTDLLSFENVNCGINDNNGVLVPDGKTLREVLAEPFGWTDTYQQIHNYTESNWETNIWAPDVIYNEAMGKYCYYASSSVWGTPHSVIWFGTSDNIEGPYENIKSIVYSGFDNITSSDFVPMYSTHYTFTNIHTLLKKGKLTYSDVKNAPWYNIDGSYNSAVYPNCIDPTVFYDKDGNLQMVYGSYFGGIYIMPLNEKTGEPDYKKMKNTDGYDIYFGKKLICTNEFNEWSGEGPYITYDSVSDYYYLYISFCGLNALGGYNIREYRSKNADGPYYDAMGNDALDYKNTGAKLFGNYNLSCLNTAYLASGHGSSFVADDGKMFHVYHTRFNSGHDGHQVRIHQMARTENGWAVVLPFEYKSEAIDENGIEKALLSGEYEFINHGSISNGCQDWAQVNNIISPTQTVVLNSDGAITGLKVYESIKENTAVSEKEVSGTWKVKNGTAYAEFTIDGIKYEGIFCKQKDESKDSAEKIVFAAIGSNNECIWGVKK